MVTRYFLPDSTLAILSKGATLEYDADKYGQANREVNMSGKIYLVSEEMRCLLYCHH